MRAAKEALNAARDGTQAGGLAFERRAWSGLFGTHDQREGMAAFLRSGSPTSSNGVAPSSSVLPHPAPCDRGSRGRTIATLY